jgi:DNA-directed RNA polymerase alpha subunit
MFPLHGDNFNRRHVDCPAVPAADGSLGPNDMAAAAIATPVRELRFSVRVRKCLQKLRIETVADLIKYSGDELLQTHNFGNFSLWQVRKRLAEHGLKLRGD